MKHREHIACILSGGIDSTAALVFALEHYVCRVTCIVFDYNQRHRKEIAAAERIVDVLSERFTNLYPSCIKLDLKSVGSMLRSSQTSSDIAVPEGHFTDISMRDTIVPNRNLIMLSVASGIAHSLGLTAVLYGAQGGDREIYPDCREEFLNQLNVLLDLQNLPRVVAPFINANKAEVVGLGNRLGTPFDLTWTCYKGKEYHCGRCGACVERREAFKLAEVPDPTVYQEG